MPSASTRRSPSPYQFTVFGARPSSMRAALACHTSRPPSGRNQSYMPVLRSGAGPASPSGSAPRKRTTPVPESRTRNTLYGSPPDAGSSPPEYGTQRFSTRKNSREEVPPMRTWGSFRSKS